MNYAFFSYVYDELMDDALYEKWLQYTDRNLKRQGQKVLELACGTGELASLMKRTGYDITGLDLSEDMLSIAYDRQLENNTRFPLIQGDMRKLEDIGIFDAVTCFSDSLCYMKDEEEILDVFRSVHSSLTDEGVFLFDVHSTYKIDKVFPGYQFHAELEGVTFVWSSYAGDEPHSIEHDLIFFIEEGQDLYRKFDETHHERTYPIQTYKKLLAEAGFQQINVTGDFGESEVGETTERWFFACRK